jgi:hypothetical protein
MPAAWKVAEIGHRQASSSLNLCQFFITAIYLRSDNRLHIFKWNIVIFLAGKGSNRNLP